MQLAAVTVLSAPRIIDLTPASPPSVRRSCGGALRGDELFVYGGFGSGGGLGDLPVYDAITNTWSVVSEIFPVRERHSMDYDPLSDRIVIVGGSTTSSVTDSVYLVDGATRLSSIPSLSPSRPSARIDALLQWAPPLGQFLYFGGRTNLFTASHVADFWALSVADAGVTWSPIAGAGTPPSPRGATCSAWDSDHQLLLVFGGETGNSTYSAETWQWAPDGGGWTDLTPLSTGTPPSARAFCATEWEPRVHRLVVYGGQTATAPTGGLFSFDPVSRVWTSHTPSGGPTALSDATARYSPMLQGIVLFGGRTSGTTYSNQTLLLRMNEPPIVDAGPDRAVAEAATVTLQGYAVDPEGAPLTVSWTQVGGAQVTFLDAGVAAATLTTPRVLGLDVALLRITASDGVDTATDTVVLAIANTINEPPMAGTGPTQIVDSGVLVTLSGSGVDPNNDLLTYTWSQVSGPTVTLSSVTSAVTTFVAPVVSLSTALDFELVAHDAVDSSMPSPTRVIVVPPPFTPDAGTDAGVDAGFTDAGSTDAGPADAGEPDAGVPDAGVVDAGPLDAGAADAGAADAGEPDAGEPDAGVPPGPPVSLEVACGCSASSEGGLALLLLAGLRRRRQGARPRSA